MIDKKTKLPSGLGRLINEEWEIYLSCIQDGYFKDGKRFGFFRVYGGGRHLKMFFQDETI